MTFAFRMSPNHRVPGADMSGNGYRGELPKSANFREVHKKFPESQVSAKV